jgi:putative membrane protein
MHAMGETRAETEANKRAHAPVQGPRGPERREAPAGDGRSLRRWLAFTARRERRLEQTGTDPDPRFTFANERTFLAWNRTALALIAAGLAVAQFLKFNFHGLRLIIAVPLIVLGAALALASYLHWEDSERAMRLRQPLHYSWMPRVLTGGIAVIAVLGGILAIVDRLVH